VNYLVELLTTIARPPTYLIPDRFGLCLAEFGCDQTLLGALFTFKVSRDVFAQIFVPILRLHGTEQTFVW
jgi:hypothetical protein